MSTKESGRSGRLSKVFCCFNTYFDVLSTHRCWNSHFPLFSLRAQSPTHQAVHSPDCKCAEHFVTSCNTNTYSLVLKPKNSPFAEGKPIPNELRKEEQALRRQVELEDDNTAVPRTHIDDEYAHAGERDPKILITTSRDPSSRLTQFAKELKLVFPNAQRINRGGQVNLFPGASKPWSHKVTIRKSSLLYTVR